MFNLMPANLPAHRRLSRRDTLRLGTLAASGMGLSQLTNQASASTSHPPTAKNCIYIFLCGGPSQLDMWNPKPEAPDGIRSMYGSIPSNVPGIQLGALIPKTSQHMDKLAIIRSMNIGTTSHSIGIHRTLLANKVSSALGKFAPPEPGDHPALGAILHKLLGSEGLMPPWVTVPRLFTTGSVFFKGQTSGFLGPGYESVNLNSPKKDSLLRTEFQLKGFDLPEKEFTYERFNSRRALLTQLERTPGATPEAISVEQMQENYSKAFSMVSSEKLKAAFDVTREKTSLRQRYGMNEYGQSFLLARRLVENDVRMVNVFWTFYGKDGCQFNLWDNHGIDGPVCGGVSRGDKMITHDYCCPSFDQAFSALLEDLSERGMLEETLVVVVGEFGRTPKINKLGGRDHWGACYSTVLAGGGVQGGQTYGRSDANAAYVADLPVSPYDLHATVLHAFGLSPHTFIDDPTGRPHPITDGLPVTAIF